MYACILWCLLFSVRIFEVTSCCKKDHFLNCMQNKHFQLCVLVYVKHKSRG